MGGSARWVDDIVYLASLPLVTKEPTMGTREGGIARSIHKWEPRRVMWQA